MDFLQANWFWLLLGVVALWWFLSRTGRGCGFGRREPDRQAGRAAGDQREAAHEHMSRDTSNGAPRRREAGDATSSRRRGC